jgi:FkbM family methyltransferase
VIAEGAGHYRRPTLIERLARAFSRLPMNAAVRSRLKRWYVTALTARTRGRGLPASLPGGETVRVLPEYAHLGWNPDEYRAFRDVVRPGMTALDVGANLGAYALLLGRWVGGSGSVYAFEPAPEAHEGLVRHVRLNGLEGVVHPVREAVGAAETTGAFVAAGIHGEGRLAAASEAAAGTQAVPVTTIDEFCRRRHLRPSFIKVDVEGAELEVLRGARDTIRGAGDQLLLFVEMHPTIWRSIGVTREQIEAELDRQGLDAVGLVPGDDPWAVEGLTVRVHRRPR